jgi:Crp-like helix-turn-helix domain
MLGMRREGVTVAVGHLQAHALIRSSRGQITIIDRKRLERHVCECYGLVRNEYARLLPVGS